MTRNKKDTLLSPYRALDLTDEKGMVCGRFLADMGADVIKIEKPGGDPVRSIGPFYHDEHDPEKSLTWWALNLNKRSITLDIETDTGIDIFKRLVEKAHFVIESFPPDYLNKLGLGYTDLKKVTPHIILTSITPFGQRGPMARYRASDIGMMAMGGLMYVTGDPDRPPLRVPFPQSYMHAGITGAIGAMVAHYHCQQTGEGQHVDVSIQASVARTLLDVRPMWDINRVIKHRHGPCRAYRADIPQRLVWQCKDGFINFNVQATGWSVRVNKALTQWMKEEGVRSDPMENMDWDKFDLATTAPELFDELDVCISQFFLRHTRAELLEGAMKRRITLYPVNNIADIVEDEQLQARNFWQEVEHKELSERIIYPGAVAILSETPLTLKRRPPFIGEHNDEVYRVEMGLDQQLISSLKKANII